MHEDVFLHEKCILTELFSYVLHFSTCNANDANIIFILILFFLHNFEKMEVNLLTVF